MSESDKSVLDALTVEQLETLLHYWQRSANPRAPIFIERVGDALRRRGDQPSEPKVPA